MVPSSAAVAPLAITGGQSRPARALAVAFGRHRPVRLAASSPTVDAEPSAAPPLVGDLRDPDYAARVVEGAGALFHLAPLWPGLPAGAADQELLDLATRGTYVLLKAAVAAGV